MPSFQIEPDEYISECSDREIEELFDLIEDTDEFKKRYYDKTADDGTPRNYEQLRYIQNLTELRRSWYQMSKEDIGIIAIIAKKYGAV